MKTDRAIDGIAFALHLWWLLLLLPTVFGMLGLPFSGERDSSISMKAVTIGTPSFALCGLLIARKNMVLALLVSKSLFLIQVGLFLFFIAYAVSYPISLLGATMTVIIYIIPLYAQIAYLRKKFCGI